MNRILSGRYQLRRHVARGGMADIYEANDLTLDRTVAVKVLRPELADDPSFVERFRAEARAAGQLNHPNIVSVFDWGTEGDDAFIVMEWVDGPTLAQVLHADGPLPPARAAELGAQVADALAYAHGHGVTHRDTKPSNVLLASSGHVKVADFGIAKVAERSMGTDPGVVLGTPSYLSPEQIEGHPADARSDVYALGAVLYQMVTGRPPFVGDTPAEVADMHLHRRPNRPSSLNPAVTPALEAILSRALARDPIERYPTAEDLRADLLRLAEQSPPPIVPEDEPTVAMTAARAAAGPDPTRALTTPVATAAPVAMQRRSALPWVLLGLVLVAAIVALALILSGGGSSAKVTVPDVTGRSQADARRALEDAGLKVAIDSTPQNNDTISAGDVISQDPAGGTEVKKGSTVTLVVSGGATTTSSTVRRATTIPRTTEATTPSTTSATLPPTTHTTPTTTPASTLVP